jgi:outer membrane murein-binding lipoprotein Lpp
LKTALIKKIASLGIASVLASGCYNTKMMEFTYQELDTVKTQQQELLEKIDELTRQFEEEREARLRAQAEHALTLRELREHYRGCGAGFGRDAASGQRHR